MSDPAVDPSATLPPDYVTDPDAVLKDDGVEWRYGTPPNYSKTPKQHDHAPGSLEAIIENLVKNWEIEASFKKRLSDWRTVNHDKYTFAIHGGQPQGAEDMLKIGTYNAIILPNEYYDPASTDFAQSHKTFKRMMPTFAWSVVETYSPPPRISFKWRHWGVMANDYCGINNKGEKVTAKAHGRVIEITGITIADIDENLKITCLKTYFDSMQMFRQIVDGGKVTIEKPDDAHETVVRTGHTESLTDAAGPVSGSCANPGMSSRAKAPRSVGFALPERESENSHTGSDGGGSQNDRESRPREERKISFARLASKLGLGPVSGGNDKVKKNGITLGVARDAKEAYSVNMPDDNVHPVLEQAEYHQASNDPGNVPADNQDFDPHEQLAKDLGSLNIEECPVMSGFQKQMGGSPALRGHAK